MKKPMIAALLVLTATAGCSFDGSRAKVSLHDLGPVTSAASEVEGNSAPKIKVSTPRWLADAKLYYRRLFKEPTILKSYSLDRWIAPPDELLERRFSLIEGKMQDMSVKIRLIEFEQQFEAPTRARCSFSFYAEASLSGGDKILGQRFFSYRLDNPTPDAAGAVASFADLSNRAADDLTQWLNELIE
ncbi:MAG: ABC-type transport auxiliary lipoprotein family protein [Gammaproteobacteria bacterium]